MPPLTYRGTFAGSRSSPGHRARASGVHEIRQALAVQRRLGAAYDLVVDPVRPLALSVGERRGHEVDILGREGRGHPPQTMAVEPGDVAATLLRRVELGEQD